MHFTHMSHYICLTGVWCIYRIRPLHILSKVWGIYEIFPHTCEHRHHHLEHMLCCLCLTGSMFNRISQVPIYMYCTWCGLNRCLNQPQDGRHSTKELASHLISWPFKTTRWLPQYMCPTAEMLIRNMADTNSQVTYFMGIISNYRAGDKYTELSENRTIYSVIRFCHAIFGI